MVGATAALFGGTNWAGMDGYIKRKIFLMKINGFRGYFIHFLDGVRKMGGFCLILSKIIKFQGTRWTRTNIVTRYISIVQWAMHKWTENGDLPLRLFFSLPLLQLLIAHNASVNHQDDLGEFALKSASNTGFTEVIEVLLSNGAEINLQDISGYTSLMQAAKRGNYEAVKILIEHGADTEIVENRLGKTAFLIAAENAPWNAWSNYVGMRKSLNELYKAGADILKQVKFLKKIQKSWRLDDDFFVLIFKIPKLKCEIKPEFWPVNLFFT